MATHYPSINEKGDKVYHTVRHNIIAWDNQVEYAERSIMKGSKILVEGSIVYRAYPGSNGSYPLYHQCHRAQFTES